ncbi:putative ABC transport system ATP-binding protein [Methylomagnum ishizawai]|uniref:Putative ABC transport system ATP-binding protein n=1 Tax=Methylomagnum ishizawai TaxID=1760988 RepID=A0A1Y6DAW1_9GAMM|nr:ATP-binding cassette domain-containing protein [Methylomagnum ishizawai]SMF97442.1 putative ABC transport system ATP-binding protein [Methylomagnum ishizawai]
MIEALDLRFGYPGFALHIPEFRVGSGEKLAIIGPSGAGKTTLLKLISGIVRAESGQLRVDGAELRALGEGARRDFRARRVGFVFQELELLDYLDLFDNIVHAYRVNPSLRLDRAVCGRARALAEEVGLGAKLGRMPHQLSQGERQRAAVCRALLPEPGLILADEATGNLDPANKVRVLDLLFRAAERRGASLLAVTHDHELLPRFDRVVDFTRLTAGGG